MDQRKFVTFLILSVLVLMLFSIMFPPPRPAKPPAQAAGEQADGKPAEDADAARDAKSEEQAVDEEQPAPDAAPPGKLPEVADAKVDDQYVTLGSLDLTSGYRMLVTLTNTGAAVRRAEMSSSRYTDQHDWSGYLGELELKDIDGGVQVQVVGPGTPAAQATPVAIEPGDVIVGIDVPKPPKTLTVDTFKAALKETDPGDSITLRVRRGNQNAPEPRTVRLVRRPLAVLRPEIENYRMRKADPPPDFVDRPSLLLSLAMLDLSADAFPGEETVGAVQFSRRLSDVLENGNWEVAERGATSVTFRRPMPEIGLEIIKRYSLAVVPPDKRKDVNYPGYHLQVDIEFRNTGTAAQQLVYRLDGPTGMPLEGWWWAHKISRQRWFGAAGLRDVVVRFDGNPVYQIDCPEIAEGDAQPMGQGQALTYAGVDGQYFAAVMIPQRQSLNEVWFDSVEAIIVGPKPEPRTPHNFTNVTCRMTRKPIEVAAGGMHRDSFQVFIGPKRPDLLAQYQAAGDPNHTLADIVYYGLALFAAVARAMLAVLHFFFGIIGNYGIAIIMLTVLVRGAMFPVSYKQTQNMARMQALKPEMDRINEKYKTDMQKRSQAMQELYRKHKINPLGGCLPLFLQLPVFIGLYRALMVDIELRQSPLFGQAIRWCSNLAAPDMLLDWSPIMPDFIDNGIGLFGLGPYLNILPIVAVVLMLLTQKMTMPPPTNEQAAMQQKMMKYMMIFIGLLFYKVASGLCLYFIASSLWGIAERKLLPKTQTAAAAADGTTGPPPGTTGRRPRDGGPNTDPNGRPSRTRRSRKAKRKK
ncbi:MAG: YidC/Oxa1 family insertase periplasmic-domain containing protein [Pirellulales bacterium]